MSPRQLVLPFLLGLALMAALVGMPRSAVTGFNSPYDVAVSPAYNYFYVTNNGNNTVSIVDLATNAILGAITGFNRPAGIAITPNGTFAYVADLGNNELVRITTATNAISEITGGFDRPYFISISSDGKTAYVTNQGNGTVSIVDLTTQQSLSVPTIAPTGAVYDADQDISLKSSWSGGAPPYAGNWVITQNSNTLYDKLYAGIDDLSNALSLSASTLGIGNYAANITVSDGSSPKQTANSVKASFSINSALNAGSIFPQSPSINAGQGIIALTANPSGGTASYSYQWYVSLTPSCNSGSLLIGTGPSIGVSPSANTYYCYAVTDDATPPVTKFSGADLVTVVSTSPPPPPPKGGGTSPGSGTAGGGIQKPTIVTMTANETYTIINLQAEQTTLNITTPIPSQNEGVALGVAVPNLFNMTLHGERLNFTTNYISPASAGLTINNQSYVLPINSSVTINQTRRENYTLSVALVNVSLAPILHTITLEVRAQPNPINITAQNSTTEIPANQTVGVQNLTSSAVIPNLPPGYDKELVQNISVSRKPNAPVLRSNTTVYTEIKYNCSIPSYDEIPLILSNYSWAQISSFTVKPNDCEVTFSFGSDPILALARHISLSPGKNTTTIPATTTVHQAPSTTIPQSIRISEAEQYIYLFILIIIILIIIAIIAYKRRKAKKAKPEEKKQVHMPRNPARASKSSGKSPPKGKQRRAPNAKTT